MFNHPNLERARTKKDGSVVECLPKRQDLHGSGSIQSRPFKRSPWLILGMTVIGVAVLALTLVNWQPAPIAAQGEFPPLALLPPVPEPLDNPITPEKVELGRLLFFDPRMSADGSISCNSCHSATTGYGASTAISFGGPGSSHWRNAQTLLNVAY